VGSKARFWWGGLLAVALWWPVEAAEARVNVVATLPDLAAIAREVGGEHVQVSAMAYPTQDPHFVDARPHLILYLNRADLLVLNGLELEVGWLPTLLTGARNGRIQPGTNGYFDASTVVPLKQVPQLRIDRSMGDLHPGGNPHFTVDPRNGALIALALAERLVASDPAHRAGYRARAQAFAATARDFAAAEAKRFAKIPANRRQVVAYHQSLIYLLDWLGLEGINNLEPKPGIPPSPGHVATVLSQMRQIGVEAILQESYWPTTASELLAKRAEAKVVVLPGGTNFDGGQTYLDYIREVVRRVAEGLKR